MIYGFKNISQIIGVNKTPKQLREFALIIFILLNLRKLMDLYK